MGSFILNLATYYSIIIMVKFNANSVCFYLDEFFAKVI